jgi:hypothetical protein
MIDRVRAVMAMLETMTLRPDEMSASGVTSLLELGVSPASVVDEVCVGFCFDTIDRITDSLGFPACR